MSLTKTIVSIGKCALFVFCQGFFFVKADYAQQPATQGEFKELFAGPSGSSTRELWLDSLKQWRINEKVKLAYNDKEYLRPQFDWVKRSFIYVQMMAHDRFFYDPVSGKYTVDRYLNDLKKRYGGIDAVLIWPTYPNIGIDNRNQYDLVSDMPGGLKGVKQMILDFKKRGVRVFFPIMIWDHGTRKISQSMPYALMYEMKIIGADGMNGDTMSGVTEDFRNAYDSLGYPIALQPELSLKDLKMIEWNRTTWGYLWNYRFVPGVSIYKWLESRHQVYITNRWATDKTDDLQYAFFNGIGYNVWENIWGIWNQVPDRYAETIRRISTIYRQFPGLWNSASWEPHIPTLQNGVFASKFSGQYETVYTIVNRDSVAVDGNQFRLPYVAGIKYFDIWNGRALTPQRDKDDIYLNFNLEGRGFGSVLAIREEKIDNRIKQFLTQVKGISERNLSSYPDRWQFLSQQIVTIPKTKKADEIKEAMITIPAVANYVFESNGVMIEGNNLPEGVGVQYPWSEHPGRSNKHIMNIPSFYIDKYPVTNEQFKKFIDATVYHPKDDHNFLKYWKNGSYPQNWGQKPVTWISLEDARAYAMWAGKRLPHEWEWQYAAQGTDGRIFPWGNKRDSSKMPLPDSSRNMRQPTDVNAFPEGASPFGVMDLVGNVWQWTDEYTDKHTRAAILKGGGFYRATTSDWYFPRAYELNKYGKYLLMAPSLDRSATIGFRCVMDK